MNKATPVFALFIVIVLEGYVVLSSELLAIRQIIPYVGSGTDSISIIIAAVLMPLAFGYYAGGLFKPGLQRNGRYISIRDKLVQNMLIALIIYVIGLSYPVLNWFFTGLIKAGIDNRLLLTSLYAGLFLVTPVYLLGQTIPLISNYFSKEALSRITGRILFFSTLGSFMGAIITTIVFMSLIGVHYTNVILFFTLAALITLLSKKTSSKIILAGFAVAFIGGVLNSGDMLRSMNVIENNRYNTVKLFERQGSRILSLNNNVSSMYGENGLKSYYIEFVEDQVIWPIADATPPKNILVIGAGGFTFGLEDDNNRYDFVDIDGSLKDIAEEHLLKQKLGENKKLHPMPARGFLAKADAMYDVIFLDVFQGDLTIPEHLLTQEFFQQMKNRLNEGGIVVSNFTLSPNFASRFSRNVDNTWRSVFPYSARHIINQRYMPWNDKPEQLANVIYVYKFWPDEADGAIYTDNKNTAFLDKPKGR